MMGLLLWHLIMSEALGLLTFGQPYYGYEICIYLSSSSCLYLTVPCCLFSGWRRTHVFPDTVSVIFRDE